MSLAITALAFRGVFFLALYVGDEMRVSDGRRREVK